MDRFLKTAKLKDLLKKVSEGEITFSKMVEEINYEAQKFYICRDVEDDKSKNVVSLRIQESKKNKKLLCLIVKTEDGKEYVCSGDHHSPTYLVELENSFDLK
jgi:hypothetical protein